MEQVLQTVGQLPEEKISEVIDFASYVLKKHEESLLQKGIERLVSASDAFAFLHEDDELYSLNDLKERY